jgi:hypothetical protein
VIETLAGGDAGGGAHLDLVHRELCRKGHAATIPGAMEMTTAAAGLHVIRIQRDEEGERYAVIVQKERGPLNFNRSLPAYTVRKLPDAHTTLIH